MTSTIAPRPRPASRRKGGSPVRSSKDVRDMPLLHRICDPARAHLIAAFVLLAWGGPGLAQTSPGSKAATPGPLLDGPLTPEEAPKSFRLEPGLRLELVAAEPLVASPVALAFDERGRLFVAENRGYPTGPGPGRAARRPDRDAGRHRRRRPDGSPDRVRRGAHVPQRRHALEGGPDRHLRPGRALPARHRRRRQGRRAPRPLHRLRDDRQHPAPREPSDPLGRQLDLPDQRPLGREGDVARGPRPPGGRS